jgi:hypothetical protein
MLPRRSAIVVALIVLLAFGARGATGAARAAQPSLATLQSAILTADEVGTGFATVSAGPQADNLAYTATFGQGTAAPTVIGVTLRLDPSSSTETVAQGAIAVLQHIGYLDNFQATPETPPALGANAVAYSITGTEDGMPATGGVVVWQQGPVLVLVFGAGTELNPGIVAIAQKQQQKLAAALGS